MTATEASELSARFAAFAPLLSAGERIIVRRDGADVAVLAAGAAAESWAAGAGNREDLLRRAREFREQLRREGRAMTLDEIRAARDEGRA